MEQERPPIFVEKDRVLIETSVAKAGGMRFGERRADGLADVESFHDSDRGAIQSLRERDSGIMLNDENAAVLAFESFQDSRKRRLVNLPQARSDVGYTGVPLSRFAASRSGPKANRDPVGAASRQRIETSAGGLDPFKNLEIFQARHALTPLGGDRS
jgi:hypothetical protein